MEIVYVHERPQKYNFESVFLAGPTPRTTDVPSWRPQAIEALREAGFQGQVFVPECRDNTRAFNYTLQIEWEEAHLHRAGCILFWVPREMKNMPALTTNVEFGMWYDSGKIILGVPPHAEHCNYLIHYANKVGAPVVATLADAAEAVVQATSI